MAIELIVETDTGATVRYWRIVRAHWDYVARVGTIYVAGYVSKEARDAGKSAMVERLVLCREQGDTPNANELPFIEEPNRSAAYGALASLPQFAGAVSV